MDENIPLTRKKISLKILFDKIFKKIPMQLEKNLSQDKKISASASLISSSFPNKSIFILAFLMKSCN